MRCGWWRWAYLAADVLVRLSAADGVVGLPELEIRAASPAPTDAGALSSGLADVLWTPAVRFAPQGSGAQTDLSIRGSAFSGAGLAVGGLSLRNPQTEHFNAELPLPTDLLEGFRVVTGLEQAHAATGHLAGSVAAEFRPVAEGAQARLGLGEAGGYEGRLLAADTLADTAWGGSLFGWRADLPGRDYAHNRAETLGGGLHLQYRDAEDQLDTAVAAQAKHFGAQGFYGVSPALLSSEEVRDLLMLASWRHELASAEDFARVGAAAREFSDEYVLDDANPPAYRNQHRTWASTASADGRTSNGRGTGTAWRVLVEDERIDSKGLLQGERTEGLGDRARQRLGLMLLPFRDVGPLTLEAGGQVLFLSEDAPAPLVLAGVRWALSDAHQAYLSYAETVRQPSFTELDYESPASLGNQGLQNEESAEIEAGLRSHGSPALQTRLAVFRRTTEHTVDWVRLEPGGRWLATDVGRVITQGIEAEAAWQVNPSLAVALFGTLLRKDCDAHYTASRYVFDYPEERLGLAVSWRLNAWCEVRTEQVLLWYAPNPARDHGRTGNTADLQVILRPPAVPHASIILACTNLLDDDLEVYPGQRRAARTVSGALAVTW